MSYILDALRRADAERDRGQVPGLHARPAGTVQAAEAAGVPWHRSWRRDAAAAGTALLLASMLLVGWWGWRGLGPVGGGASADRTDGVRTALPAAAVSASTRAGATTTAPSATERSAPVELERPPPQARPAAAIDMPIVRPSRRPPQPAMAATTPSVGGKVADDAVPSKAASASAAASAPIRVYSVDELPEDVRRDLPRLAIGGSIYSPSPNSRFVIVNGQLFHEGDTLAPGLVLQQVKLRSAVLAFRGYRYGISY